jgi:hypothetical protein
VAFEEKYFIDIRTFFQKSEKNCVPSNNGLKISIEFINEFENIAKILNSVDLAAIIEESFHVSLRLPFPEKDKPRNAVFKRGDNIYFKYRFAMAYAFEEYNASKELAYVKQKVMERDNFSCVNCKTFIQDSHKGVVHHEHYDNWGRGDEFEIDSCVYLCKRCHRIRHNKPDMKLKVPFWARRGSLWDKCSEISQEVIAKAMQNLWEKD